MKVAVVGLGVMGKNHLRVYSELKNIKVCGICDINLQEGNKLASLYHIPCYQNVEELILTERPDALSVAVPTIQHKEITLTAIKHGVHVLVEKPIAPTFEDAMEIAYAARRQNLVLQVGHIERFNPAIIKTQELIKKNKLGEIISVVARRVGVYPPRIKDVNVVTDLAVHDMNIITTLMGRIPYFITATGGNSFTGRLEDHAEIFMDFGNVGCFIQVNWVTPIKIRSLAINGSKSYLELNYVTQDIDLYKSINFEKSINSNKYTELVKEIQENGKVTVEVKKSEPLKLEIENFINSVKGIEKPRVSGEDGAMAIKLSGAALESIKTGEKIKIN